MPCAAHGSGCRGHARSARKRRRELEPEELGKLVAACRTDEERAVLWLVYDLALRAGELSLLRVRDFSLDGPEPTVWTPRLKDGEDEPVGVSRHTAVAVEPFVAGPFLARDAHPFTAWTADRFRAFFRRLVARAGLPTGPAGRGGKGYSHILRRSRATHLIERGAGIKDVQYRLGHKSASTTALYVGMTNARRRVVDRIARESLEETLQGNK